MGAFFAQGVHMRRIFRFLVPAMALVLFSSGCGRLELLRTKELRELQAEKTQARVSGRKR